MVLCRCRDKAREHLQPLSSGKGNIDSAVLIDTFQFQVANNDLICVKTTKDTCTFKVLLLGVQVVVIESEIFSVHLIQ